MEEINSPPTHKSQEQAQPGHSANQRREHQGEGRTQTEVFRTLKESGGFGFKHYGG